MKHIVSFSGGKDSTAMLLRMIELNMRIDEIIWFDCDTWEFPQMKTHVDKVSKFINREITILKDKKGFDYWMFDHKFTRGKRRNSQRGYGFPSPCRRWCTRQKADTLGKHMRGNIVYFGYAIDEYQRQFKSMIQRKKYEIKYPLIEWGWSEADCLNYCYLKEFNWEGLYKIFHRVSCWCCPLQGLEELRRLRKHFPFLWHILLDMQRNTWGTFRTDGTTVFDLEKRFQEEDKQLNLFMESI